MFQVTQSAQISPKQDGCNIYAIMKTMCPLGYHHNVLVATDALGHILYGCGQVHELPQSHCGDNQESTLISIYLFIHLCNIIHDIYIKYICYFIGKMKAILSCGGI